MTVSDWRVGCAVGKDSKQGTRRPREALGRAPPGLLLRLALEADLTFQRVTCCALHSVAGSNCPPVSISPSSSE